MMPTRNIALDITKLIMAIMVVGLHCDFLSELGGSAVFFLRNGLFRIAVPIFFCINGYYFYSSLTKNKTSQWLMRMFYLYIFWSIIYSFSWFTITENLFDSLVEIIYTLANGFFHLWYIVGSIGAAILVIVTQDMSDKKKLMLLIILYLIGSAIMYSGNYHLIKNWTIDTLSNNDYVHRNFIFFAFPFFTLGLLIRKHNLSQRISPFNATLLFLSGCIFLMVESYLNRTCIEEGFDNFLSLIILCPAFFILITKINFSGTNKTISNFASGVYFIHPLFMIYLNGYFTSPSFFTVIVVLLSLIASFLLIQLHKKLPFIL